MQRKWVASLRQAVIEAAARLEAIPHAGVRDASAPLFKLVLRTLPFVVWDSAPLQTWSASLPKSEFNLSMGAPDHVRLPGATLEAVNRT